MTSHLKSEHSPCPGGIQNLLGKTFMDVIAHDASGAAAGSSEERENYSDETQHLRSASQKGSTKKSAQVVGKRQTGKGLLVCDNKNPRAGGIEL